MRIVGWLLVVVVLQALAMGPLRAAEKTGPVSRVNIAVDKKAYRFTTNQFTVKAGSRVLIVLSVPEQSTAKGANLVILKPGTERRFMRALRMMPDPKTNNNRYAPNSPDILTQTRWLTPGTLTRLTIKVPDTPGSYSFLCTWPRGAAGSMKGIMRVVK